MAPATANYKLVGLCLALFAGTTGGFSIFGLALPLETVVQAEVYGEGSRWHDELRKMMVGRGQAAVGNMGGAIGGGFWGLLFAIRLSGAGAISE